MDATESFGPRLGARLRAYGVHILTATGAVLGLAALLAVAAGALNNAVLLMLAALLVDAVDGTLARAARVSEVTPGIDGRRLDDIVDYLNFVIVPAFFMWGAGSLVHSAWLAAPVLASAYGFARVDAKTEDDFFLGFPSYWNLLAFYLWLLAWPPWLATILTVGLSMAVFLPLKFLYPSKVQPLGLRFALGAGALLWVAALVAAVAAEETEARQAWTLASLAYPAWYVALSATRGAWFRAG